MDDDYELLDFGEGRKLEMFSGTIVNRPAPQATETRRHPHLWRDAALDYRRSGTHREDMEAWVGVPPVPWTFAYRRSRFQLKASPAGQVGIFPEQFGNWFWLEQQMDRLDGEQPRVLNLFAYTGGSTLAVASKASEVVHVDASKPVVQWARQNADLSQMSDCPIRWIVDDVSQFVARESRRKRRYHGIILDPPTFGRGPSGQRWQIHSDLPSLVEQLFSLLLPQGFLLLTCHTTDVSQGDLRSWLEAATGSKQGRDDWSPLSLTTSSGKSLPSGLALRWEGVGT
jgi:23S rRNA (cytosine1962-C5)-methyltransferase